MASASRLEWGSGSSRLLKKMIGGSFIPSFLLALTYNINGLADSLLAGVFLTPAHIAAIGVVLPVQTLCTALLSVIVLGTYGSYSETLARGQRRKSRELFTVGLIDIAVIGCLLAVVCAVFARPIVTLFGAATEELRELSMRYLRFTAMTYPFVAAAKLITLILSVYGYQKDSFAASLTGLACNVLFSVLLLLLVPGAGIGALGIGTLAATVPTLAVCYAAARRHGLPIEFRVRAAAFRMRRVKSLLVIGGSMSLNSMLDALAAGLPNRTIVGSALGAAGLAFWAIVHCFWKLAEVGAEGMDYASGPMTGVCYACRDKGGLRMTLNSALGRGVVYSAVWVLILYALMPLLLRLYLGNADTETVRRGVLIALAFIPVRTVVILLSSFFSYTEHVGASMYLAIVPDSVVFPALTALLVPPLGYTGLWLALGGSAVAALILTVPVFALIRRVRSGGLSLDRMLLLDTGRCAEYPAVDVSLVCDNGNISDLTEKIQTFLKGEEAASRTSYLTALCVDELASDYAVHSSVRTSAPAEMDIKIISEEDSFRIIVCSVTDPYNPFDFVFSSEDFSKVGLMMVRRIAEKIDYEYLYKMNMITIRIAK